MRQLLSSLSFIRSVSELLLFVERHYPNVSEGNGVAVILKHQRTACGTAITGYSAGSYARQNDVVVNNDAVVDQGHSAVLFDLAVLIETGSTEDDVIGLPLKSRLAGICKRSVDAVNTGAVVVQRRLIP